MGSKYAINIKMDVENIPEFMERGRTGGQSECINVFCYIRFPPSCMVEACMTKMVVTEKCPLESWLT